MHLQGGKPLVERGASSLGSGNESPCGQIVAVEYFILLLKEREGKAGTGAGIKIVQRRQPAEVGPFRFQCC